MNNVVQNQLSKLPSKDEIPETLGKYKLSHELGRGTCGLVYKAFDPFVNRPVALKLAYSQEDAGNAEASRQYQREFFSEAHAAGKLQHPHIVAVYDASMDGPFNYIVMEYIDGGTLADYVRPGGERLPVSQIVDIMFKCAKALNYSHREGVLHRDIKPGNIMLNTDGEAKIMDFSIAEIMQGDSLRPDKVVGSPAYMPPEQLQRQEIGATADLYSLGAVMYHLLAGEPPFMAQEMRMLFEMVKYAPAPNLRDMRPELPAELCAVVDKLLRKDPAQRYQSGDELAKHLARLYNKLTYADRQISRKESQNSLASLRFFADFSDSEIEEIVDASNMLSFQPGETIIKEGDIDNAFYIIAVGQVTVRKGGKDLMVLGKGDVLGEIAFLSATKRTATVIANTQVLALKVNAMSMEQVSENCQLRYYKVFCETLIYRLSLTSAKLSAS